MSAVKRNCEITKGKWRQSYLDQHGRKGKKGARGDSNPR